MFKMVHLGLIGSCIFCWQAAKSYLKKLTPKMNFILSFCGTSHRICQRSEKAVVIPCFDLEMVAKCIICVIWWSITQCTCNHVKPKLYIFLGFLHVFPLRGSSFPSLFPYLQKHCPGVPTREVRKVFGLWYPPVWIVMKGCLMYLLTNLFKSSHRLHWSCHPMKPVFL